MINTLCGLLSDSSQLATGRIELHNLYAKQQGPQTASDRPSKQNFFCPPARASCDPYFTC